MAIRLKDIARETGFAVSTVSNVLNKQSTCFASDETRRRIVETAREMGYRPNYLARGLRRQRTNTIGVVGSLFGSESASRFMQRVSLDLRDAGYDALFMDTLSNRQLERHQLRELQVKQVDGLIIRGSTGQEVEASLVEGMPPSVLVSDPLVAGCVNVVFDRARGVERVVDWLVASGHRELMLVVGRRDSNATKVTGYCRGLARAGLEAESTIVEAPVPTREIRQLVLDREAEFRRPTAILAGSDELAAALMPSLRQLGRRVPEDCSVVGFDDSTFAAVSDPPLTTLRQPVDELGRAAVELLLAQLAGKQVVDRVFEPELILRESTRGGLTVEPKTEAKER